MKKPIFMIMICLLAGCAKYFKYDYDTLKSNVISAEIIDISYEQQTDNSVKTIITLVNIVDSEKLDDLFKDVSNINILERVGSPKSAEGRCLKLIFSNGNYEIIYQHSIDTFSIDGTFIKYKNIGIQKTDFINLISKYMII